MKPIFLDQIYKSYIWGGNKLYNKGDNLSYIADSWELSNNNKCVNKIKRKYRSLAESYSDKDTRIEIFGTLCTDFEKIPLLIKLIDEKQNLSIQVHPDEKYGKIGSFCIKGKINILRAYIT